MLSIGSASSFLYPRFLQEVLLREIRGIPYIDYDYHINGKALALGSQIQNGTENAVNSHL